MKLRSWCKTANMTHKIFCIWLRMCLVLCLIFSVHGAFSEDANSDVTIHGRNRKISKILAPDSFSSSSALTNHNSTVSSINRASHQSSEVSKSPYFSSNSVTAVSSEDRNIFSNTSIATLSRSTDLGEARSSTKLDSNSVSGAFIRGLYVFVGLSALITMYIAIKFIRLKRKRTHIRKYGLLANVDDVEMTPLDIDDDEEDTLFDTHRPGY